MLRWGRMLIVIFALVLGVVGGPIAPAKATTRPLVAVLKIKATCAPNCRAGNYTGPSLGPSLATKMFRGSWTYTLPFLYATIGNVGKPDQLQIRVHWYTEDELGNWPVEISSGQGIFEGATGSGTLNCPGYSRVGTFTCVLNLELTTP